jgi:hypothetical protein
MDFARLFGLRPKVEVNIKPENRHSVGKVHSPYGNVTNPVHKNIIL